MRDLGKAREKVERLGKVIGAPQFIYMGHGDNNCTYPVRVVVTIKCDTVYEKPIKESTSGRRA